MKQVWYDPDTNELLLFERWDESWLLYVGENDYEDCWLVSCKPTPPISYVGDL